jgi:cytochrome c553
MRPQRPEIRGLPLVRSLLKHPWLTAGAVGTAIALGTIAVVISGLVPIKASSGHWAITTRLLDFSKVRSVATHALTLNAPPLDDASLVLRGAGHYETACAPCHGGPGTPVPPVMAAMTPPPPELPDHVGRWNPEELFYIVKHGIKFTGMPAWPIQERDDEVWAMVAFLRRLPGMDAATYRGLIHGDSQEDALRAGPVDPSAPAVVRAVCSRCHGLDGSGRGNGAFASLAGQHSEYLRRSLEAFADRRRLSGIMGAVATTLDEEAMREIASYYAKLPQRVATVSSNATVVERGQSIAAIGVPDRNIPACRQCHGPSEEPRNPAYPILASQHPEYLKSQLQLLRQRTRGGSGNENLMHVFVDRLRAEDIEAVTNYYGQLESHR